jgi:tetratricopeptide (TPR) repeat protein
VNIPGWDNPQVSILELVSNWLCDEVNGRWVMIVDNADDVGVFSQLDRSSTSHNSVQVTQPLLDFLPQSLNGSTLITSRSRDAAYKLTGSDSDIIKVEPMDEDQALSLLQKKLPGKLDRNEGGELVHTLDCMPLAITQAAAYISQRSPRITVSKYLSDLRKGDEERASLLKKDLGDTRRDGRASNSIIATWQISFEYIRKEWSSAARLLSLMSLFDRQGIPDALLLGSYEDDGIAEADFEDDISILTSFSLVTMNTEGNEFEMHRLVQFSTKKWLELRDELGHWKEKYIIIMVQAFPIGQHENWATCEQLYPHAEMVLSYRPTNKDYLERWASILFDAAWYSDDKGNYAMAEKMNQQAIEGYKKALGAEHPSTLSSMANLASTYWNQGRWKEAEELDVQVLETSKRVLGVEHPDTLINMANLASTYRNQGRWKEAEELNVQVLETSKRVLGVEHPDTLINMANLASTYWNQGRWKEAEELNEQVLETSKRVLGVEHPSTLISMSDLASTYRNQGRWKEAEELNVQVLETSKRVLGVEHPSTLTSMSNLASTYWNQGRWKEAEELNVQVLETSKRVLGVEHPDTLMRMGNLAMTWKSQGYDEQAINLMSECVQVRQRKLGVDHPDTVSSSQSLKNWQAR